MVQVREVTLLSLDDLLIVAREFLNTWLEDFTAPAEISAHMGDLYRRINDTLEKGGSFAALKG